MSELITKEEIAEIRRKVKLIDIKKFMKYYPSSKYVPDITVLKSGYSVMISIIPFPGTDNIIYLSTKNHRGDTDPADAEYICKATLGIGYEVLGEMTSKGLVGFMKPENEKDLIKIKAFKKLEHGNR